MYLNWIANEFEFTDGLALLLPAIEMFIICYVTHQIQTEVGLFLLSHSFDQIYTVLLTQAAEISRELVKLRMTNVEHQREVKKKH